MLYVEITLSGAKYMEASLSVKKPKAMMSAILKWGGRQARRWAVCSLPMPLPKMANSVP